jgi:hypothetical protein
MASDSNSPSVRIETVTTVIEVQTTSEHVATRSSTVYTVSSFVTTTDGTVIDTVTSVPTGVELVFYSTTEVLNVSVTNQVVVTSMIENTPTTSSSQVDEVSLQCPASQALIDRYRSRRAQTSYFRALQYRPRSQQSCLRTRIQYQVPTSMDSPLVLVFRGKQRSVSG